ncbi:YphA family membrane protein [Sediminibacillus massiliensis]|uniref:YphA family membrane protein n=1 Tax=Sediminibacillus massiliensis TaxID=1926277 RepID=UPI0009883ADF|nr:hypothetical protein [Sediminibacillus massiliensis]
MEGLFFYWISWMVWVFFTFLYRKDRFRIFMSAWILLLIICSEINATFVGYQVNMAVIVSFCGGMILHARSSRWLYHNFCTLCLVFSYTGILFWEMISPIWVFMPRLLMVPFLGVALLFFVCKTFRDRCAVWTLGVTTGEILHTIILNSYGFSVGIGQLSFLDLMMVGISFNLLATLMVLVKRRVEIILQSIEEKLKMRWNHE